MASTVQKPPTEQYVDFQEYVDFQLKKARQQIRSTDLLMAGTVAAVIVVGYLLAFVIADQWLFAQGLPTAWRWLGLVIWLGALAGWIGWRFGIPLMNSVTGLFAAQQVERSEPELRSNLLNWVDLQRAGRPVDPAVLRAIERQAAVQLSKIDVNQAVDHRPLLRSGYALLAVMALFCLYAVLSPKKLTPSLWRVLPVADVAVPTRTEIRNVTPGDADVLARSRLEVTVELGGDIPKQVRLVYTTSDQKFRDEPVVLQPDGEAGTRFRTLLAGETGQGLLRDLTYRIEAGDAVSRDYRVTVAQPPSARVEQIQLIPPEYTRLPEETHAGGQFTGWEGSLVRLTGSVNLPVKSARLQFLDEPQGQPTGEEVAVKVDGGTRLSAEWTLQIRTDGKFSPFYRIQCQTADGRTDPSPVVYQVTILKDHGPELAVLAPERDLTVPANAVIPILAEARDPDFELGPVTLQVNQGNESLDRTTLFPGKQQSVRIQHDLALRPFQLKPGDEITFHLEAQDNRQPTRNRTASPPIRIRIEAPTEDRKVQEQLAAEKTRQREQIAELDRQNAERNPPPQGDREPLGEPEAPRDRQPRDDQPADDPGQQPMPGEQPADGQSGTAGKGSEKGQPSPSQSGGSNPGEAGQSDEPSKLSPDGQDDQDVLQKLVEKFQKDGQKPGERPSKSPSDDGAKPNSATNAGQTEGPTGQKPTEASQSASKPDDNSTPKTEPTKTGEPKTSSPTAASQPAGDEPRAADPMTDRTAGPTDKSAPNDQTGANKPGESTKPSQAPKDDSAKPTTNPSTTGETPPKSGDSQTGQKSPSRPNENGDPGAKPKPGDQTTPNDSATGPMPAERMPADSTTNPGKSPAKQEEQSPQPNADAAKPNAQPSGTGGKESSPTGETPPSPPPASKSGTGNEPAKSQPGTPGTEPTNPTGTKPNSPMTGDSPPASTSPMPSPDKQPNSGPPQSRDGSPDGQDAPPKGDGRSQPQRSDRPQGGEGGGSQQAQDGNSGSQQRGPGESTGRPGEQESGQSSSNQANPGNPQQGGKNAGGQQQGGQQQGGQQQGGQQQGGQQQGGQQQGGQQQGGQQQGGQQQGGQQQGGQQQGGQQQGGQQQGGQQQGGQQQGGQQQGGQQQGGQQQGGQQQGGQQQGGQQQGGQQQGGQQQGGQQQGGQQQGGKGQGGSGQTPGAPDGAPSGMGGIEQMRTGGNGGSTPAPEGDSANLEFKKQAAELVLQRLKENLDRGDVDQQMLEDLGWTKDDMQRFVERLGQSLKPADEDNSPEAIARRIQFEEMLRGLNLERGGNKRKAGEQPHREVDQIESRRAPVPAQYRKAWEKYTQQLSKQPAAPRSP